MSENDIIPIRLSQAERLEHVVAGVVAGKSNRAIAKELRVDEKTIRDDRKVLARPIDLRAVEIPTPEAFSKATESH